MLILFYILAIQQLLQGIYSAVQGLIWLRFVRRRLATHAGFYSPRVAVICPCKGADPGLESNLQALTHFDYPNYELVFVVAKATDGAVKIIERIKSLSQRKIHLVIAGPPEDVGEKVSNLTKAVEGLNEAYDVFVFTDSDIAPSRGWLTKLVTPLNNARVGATTTYRWLIPVKRNGKSGLASAVGSVWNASIATMLGEHSRNFCWGGGTAIRRQVFQEIGGLAYWQGAVSDDLALTNALRNDGRGIEFVPECLAPTPYATTLGRVAGIHQPPDYFDARLFANDVDRGSDYECKLRPYLSGCIHRNPETNARRRRLGRDANACVRDSALRRDQRRAANRRSGGSPTGVENADARLVLDVDGASSGHSVPLLHKFLRLASHE